MSVVIRKTKIIEEVHITPSKTRGCVENTGTERCDQTKCKSHTQKRKAFTEKYFSVLIQPFTFQFTLCASRLIIIFISYLRLLD